jgi:hypothetical protein
MIIDIVSIGLYVFLALTLLIGALVGLKRGLYRSGVKLLANIVSVALTFLIVDSVPGILVEKFALGELISKALGIDNAGMILDVASIVVALVVFALVFFIVRVLMLIPQHLVCRKLSKKYSEAVGSNEVTATEGETTETPADIPAYKDAKSGVYTTLKVLWGVFASAFGAVGAVIVVGVYVFPLVCFLLHTAEPISKAIDSVPDTLTVEEETLELAEVKRGYKLITSHPALKVVDVFYGKTVYRPLMNIELEVGKGNLDDSMCAVLGVAADVLPSVLDVMEKETFSTEHIDVIKEAVEDLSEDKVTVSVTALGMNACAGPFGDMVDKKAANASELTKGEHELLTAVENILKESTAQTVSDDLKAIADMLDSFEGSNIFSLLANDEKASVTDLANDKLFDEETLGYVFGAAHDSNAIGKIIIPAVNLCFEGVFSQADVEPVYTNKVVSEIPREEFVEEGKRLSRAFRSVAAFIESAGKDGADVTSYDFSAIGKALDSIRDSILFGDQYDALANSFSQIMKKESSDEKVGEILDIVQNAVAEGDSAEKVLSSTQDIIVFTTELQNGEKKGSENEKIVSALENLKNLESENDRKAVNTITEEVLGSVLTTDRESKTELMAESVNAITEVLEEGTYDSKAEADAIQKLYDVANSKEKDSVSGNEKEITDCILNSQIADTLINNLNAKGENYGIDEDLTSSNRKNFLDAINASEADDARKEALKKFFGLTE